MAWQSSTINPATTSPAADITKITNDLQVLRSVLGGGTDGDVPVSFLNLAYTGTLTGGTGVINIGGGQIYKDASGNVGLNLAAPLARLHVAGGDTLIGIRASNETGNALMFFENTNASSAPQFFVAHSGAGVHIGNRRTDGNGFLSLFSANLERVRIDAGGNMLLTGNGALGYGAGSGGTVTQATSKTTGVTLNRASGLITMNNASLAAGASVQFTVTNSLITTNDVVAINPAGNANYRAECAAVNAGNFFVRVTNISGGALSDALQVNFALIKVSST